MPTKGVLHMKTVLTIAGSDPSGGAGIQADIKTLMAHGIYASSAITALTAQNTTGVKDVLAVPPDFLAKQLDCVLEDIFPDAIKIGMTLNQELLTVIIEKLEFYQPTNIVADPVMVSTSGRRLLSEDAITLLKTRLFPMTTLITPNIPETQVLADMEILSAKDMLTAAEKIAGECHCAVLCKGGHSIENADDLLYENGTAHWFPGARIDNPNNHGTGCTLSSAIAANLAKDMSLVEAVSCAKTYITGALSAGLNLGKGNGPLDHGYHLSIPSFRK